MDLVPVDQELAARLRDWCAANPGSRSADEPRRDAVQLLAFARQHGLREATAEAIWRDFKVVVKKYTSSLALALAPSPSPSPTPTPPHLRPRNETHRDHATTTVTAPPPP